MINENKFWKLIATTLTNSSLENIIEYDSFLINHLKKEEVQTIVGFHLRLLELRKALDNFEVIKVAMDLGYYTSREVFNRFCNGIIASGKNIYTQAKNQNGMLIAMLANNPERLRTYYYEGFSLIASASFYEKVGLDKDWDMVLCSYKEMR
ncbi:DUF4240 domain-containing protein [Aquimarina hainanensis]|uniref:DUF4240 domain-containing protein n=1 Tax=Aquimarina hainanensis TaxID=1578017 RepID=A0ABW5NA04_9FLAO